MSASSASTAMWCVFPFSFRPTVNCTSLSPPPLILEQTFSYVQQLRSQLAAVAFSRAGRPSLPDYSQPTSRAPLIAIHRGVEFSGGFTEARALTAKRFEWPTSV